MISRCVLLPLVLAGCSAPNMLSAEEGRLVDLLRQGRVDEATQNTARIARAIAFHVEELSDPKEILTAANRLWKGYPFSIADLAVDVDLLERVAEKEAESRASIEPRTSACTMRMGIEDFGEIQRHPPDGGRCARRAYRILRERVYSLRNPDFRDVDKLKIFLDFMIQSFGPDVFVLLAGLRIEQTARLAGATRRDAYALRDLQRTRWDRLVYGHLAWLRAHLFKWETDWHEFEDAADKLEKSSPELDRLARAFHRFCAAFQDCRSEKDARPALDQAVAEIEAAAPGTPFARAARLGRMEAWANLKRHKEALAEFRKRSGADVEEAPRILLWIAMMFQSQEDAASAKALLQEVLSTYGTHASSLLARVRLAEILLKENAEDGAIRQLEDVFQMPIEDPVELDDESPDYARSDAARMLAILFEKRGDWNRSLLLWRDWVPATFCGTCDRQMEDQRHYHLGLALDNLQRPKESVDEYWLAAPAHEEAAKACRALHVRLGSLADLQRKVEESVRKAKEHDPELQGYAGLRWLEENLKK